MFKKILIIVLIQLLLMLGSCWDKTEIEKWAFILGIGIDNTNENGKIKVTYQIALPQAFGGEQGGEGESTWNITETAEDINAANAALLKSIDRIPTFEHCKVLLLGEAYAKKGISQSLDFFFRDTSIRSKVSVAVVQGEAKKALELAPKTSKASAMYIDEIIRQNSNENFEIFSYQNIGILYENYVRESPVTIARIIPLKDKLDISGVGVFDGWKLLGWFNGKESEGLAWIIGSNHRGSLGVDLPSEKGGRVILRVFSASSLLKPKLQGNRIVAQCNIRVEGDITEIEYPNIKEGSQEFINELQKEFEKNIRDTVEKAFYKGRDQFHSDNMEIDKRMEQYYPNYWASHQKDWKTLFRTVQLETKIDVKVRRIGGIKY